MDIRYYVNEEERIVVCVLNGCRYDFVEVLNRTDNPITNSYYISCRRQDIHMKDSFRGIARCAEGDEWNEEYGKKLAYHRAKNAHDKCLFNKCNKMMVYLDKKTDELADTISLFGYKLSRNFDKRKRELE